MTELPFVACPFFVDCFVGSTVNAGELSASVVKPNGATGGTLGANRFA